MVRFCIVPNCPSSDVDVLSHRFPKNDKLKNDWLKSLNIINVEDYDKYVVCTLHFDAKDYRHMLSNHLNWTACPKLYGIRPRINIQNNIISNNVTKVDITTKIQKITNDNEIKSNQNDNYKERRYYLYEDDNNIIGRKKRKLLIKDNETELIIGDNEFNENDEEMISNNEEQRSTVYSLMSDNENLILVLDQKDNHEDNLKDGINNGNSNSILDDACGDHAIDDNNTTAIVDNTNPPTYFKNVACQTINHEIKNDSDDDNDNEIDNEYSKLTKNELIKLLEKSNLKILELENKVSKIENAHSNLMNSLKNFQSLL